MVVDIFRSFGKPFTGGICVVDGRPICVTLELPWLENEKQKSCIPTGQYHASRWYSPRFKNCWLLHDVPGRSEILIHTGNFVTDTSGCVLVGSYFTNLGIGESRKALKVLDLALVDYKEVLIRIHGEASGSSSPFAKEERGKDVG